jgi:hypothetical protein
MYKEAGKMDNFTDVKLEIFVPQEYAFKIRDELAKVGVGRLGDYDHCVAMVPIRGFFRPLPGSNPFEGEQGKISEVAEYKVEVNCRRELVDEAIRVIRSIHPYEEPLVNVIPLANHLFEMKSMSGQ